MGVKLGNGKWAIKEDKLLAYNDNSGRFFNKEFDFSRGSSATYVAKDGLIKTAGLQETNLVNNGDFSELGAELVTNGNFDTDSDWVKQTGVTISNGAAHWDGTQTSNTRCYQVITSLVQGKQYKVVFTATITSGAIFANLKGNSSGTSRTTSGTYTETIIGGSSDNNFLLVGDDNFIGSIDNVSVKQVDPNDYWTITNNTGTDTIIKDEYVVIKTDGTFTQIAQSNILSIGKTYKLKYNVIESDNGNLGLEVGGSTTLIPSTVGTHTFIWTSNNSSLVIKRYSGALDISITNISVVEILGDKPRIDYTDSLTSPSFLLEPQSTNLFPYSENFSQWSALNSAIVTDNFTTSPDGTQNASKFTFDGTLTGRVEKEIAVTNGNEYTFSIWLKNDNLSDPTQVWLAFSTFGQGGYITVTNEWQRFTTTQTANGTNEYPRVQTNEVGSIFAWGAQLEELSYPTSYIPTAGSTVTRAEETCIGAGNVSTFNSTEGVLYAEMAALSDDGTTRYVSVSDGANQNAIAIRFSDVNNQILAYTRIGGVFNAVLLTSSYSTVNFNKIAYRYKSGDSALFINGTKISSSTSTQTLPANTLNTLGFDDGLYAPMKGKVKGVYVFNEALTDDDLQQLTGPEYNSFAALAAAYNYTVI